MKRENELCLRSNAEIDAGLARIWQVMRDCMERGIATEGILPGGLQVRRRAHGIRASLIAERGTNLSAPHTINDWMSLYAMAVNEENAAGGQVVTAPTNGAAGVVPAVIRYWLDHVPGASQGKLPEFLLTAAAIGGLVKHNASISGAECGCQAEVGSAAAMAAATGAGALHREERPWRHQGGRRGVAGLARRRQASRQSRCLYRDHAPDRAGHACEIQGNLAGRTGRQCAELLRGRKRGLAQPPDPRGVFAR
jgi:hypothetical protein